MIGKEGSDKAIAIVCSVIPICLPFAICLCFLCRNRALRRAEQRRRAGVAGDDEAKARASARGGGGSASTSRLMTSGRVVANFAADLAREAPIVAGKSGGAVAARRIAAAVATSVTRPVSTAGKAARAPALDRAGNYGLDDEGVEERNGAARKNVSGDEEQQRRRRRKRKTHSAWSERTSPLRRLWNGRSPKRPPAATAREAPDDHDNSDSALDGWRRRVDSVVGSLLRVGEGGGSTATTSTTGAAEHAEWSCCPICLDPLPASPSAVCRGACSHSVHAACLTAWLIKTSTDTCPVCCTPLKR